MSVGKPLKNKLQELLCSDMRGDASGSKEHIDAVGLSSCKYLVRFKFFDGERRYGR